MSLRRKLYCLLPTAHRLPPTRLMKVIVTRPSPDAESFARRLMQIGADPILSPVMAILRRDVALDLEQIAALAFTSANGVRAFAGLSALRNRPVFAVGSATAAAARAAGFADVQAAQGDVETLAALIAQSKPAGPILHLAGSERAGDLILLLARRGVEARRAALYDAVEIDNLEPQARALLAESSENPAVVLFSPRSARLFLAQARRAGLAHRLNNAVALCLSQDVAAAAGAATWLEIRVAETRDADAMLRLVSEVSERIGRMSAPR